MEINHFNEIKKIIDKSEDIGLEKKAKDLSGFSGEKLIGTLQRLMQYHNFLNSGCYLEIGVFQGLTLLSVASVIKGNVYGIDNFSQFDQHNENYNLVIERAKSNDLTNINIINCDYEDALENLNSYIGDQKIGVYFIDGPHDYRSQLVCLQLAKFYLSKYAVIIVDDSNYEHVRLANRDFLLANPEFKLLYEAYTDCQPLPLIWLKIKLGKVCFVRANNHLHHF